MPDETKIDGEPVGGEGTPQELVVQGGPVTLSQWVPPAGYEAQFEEISAVDVGLLFLRTAPRWDAGKWGDLTYGNFVKFLGNFLKIDPEMVEIWFARVGREEGSYKDVRDGATYCRNLFMLYSLREQSLSPLTRLEAPVPPKRVQESDVDSLGGCGTVLAFTAVVGSLAICCLGAMAKNYIDAHPAPMPTAIGPVVQPIAVPAVPWRVTNLKTVVALGQDLDRSQNPLDPATLSFLESCGAKGYVLVQCQSGTSFTPEVTPIDPNVEADPSLCYGNWGTCGEVFISNESNRYFTWRSAADGTIQRGHRSSTELSYRPVFPPVQTECATVGSAVVIAPIVPIATENVPEDCTVIPPHPVMQ